VFLVLAFVLLLILPSPWDLVGFATSLVLFVGELAFWHRKVRGQRRAVGAQRLIGTAATVVSACRPDGQVRIGREIWAARCDEGADFGDSVTIVGRDGLTLVVMRAGRAAPS
jgi:membrane protein implicated in regulation of membrane protease activity